MKKVLVFLADGFEEVEALTPVDYLRRAGIEVATVSITIEKTVQGAHKIPVIADSTIFEIDDEAAAANADALVIPGGLPGSSNLAACAKLSALIKKYDAAGKLIAAICAAPALVLAPLGVLDGRRFTCYPGMEADVTRCGAGDGCPEWTSAADSGGVVVSDNIITSRGAGLAAVFSFKIIEKLLDKAASDKIKEAVLA
jgi:4-methyl-5(b-hydroxyethyl)-thiazole monophosphate biosynthesis